jgi:hypothetical protein
MNSGVITGDEFVALMNQHDLVDQLDKLMPDLAPVAEE